MRDARATVKPMKNIRSPRHEVAARPFIVIWEITRACPLACRHCRAEARPERDPGELSTAEACELMSQVASFGSPPPLFVMTGGDPFQRPDLFELVRHGTRIGLPVAVSPSGTPTLTAENLAALKEAGARAISLSLDGSNAAVHDDFRATEGVFRWTLDAWRAARDLGLKVQINTTVTGHNLTDLPQIVRLVHELGALSWSAFLLVPTGRGRLLPGLDAAQVEDLLNFVYDAGDFVPSRTTEAHHFRRVIIQRDILRDRGDDPVAVLGLGPLYESLHRELMDLGLPRRRVRRAPMDINSARGFVFVSHRGSVHPSGFLPVGAGDVRDTPLPEIYRNSPLFTGLRDPDLLKGRCGACEFRVVCGGSRSRALAVSGDSYGEEPWCSYEPGSFPYQDALAAAGMVAPGRSAGTPVTGS
ncbi:TIGR04053 family radical SAM/SPASM domain-containing protein [Actinomadura sp. GC306]|uniref:TIGR04053 family radical SAM/SPASM domain-containing protein n=1 Tax=Actinomadura sp. GC306 TaxID=2530367 RepID=UPI001042F924|nr:TIGR04053 family radical SAM/SPASM domain-containing protein [Actinomadura sp. GC306]TDC69706.1 TIGR04053 family radical SAM/SPASM domain-containing protein [Actinomadura sp. GC306]